MKNIIQICFFLLFLIVSENLFAKDSITWMPYNAPPFFILDGDFHGQGRGDKIIQLLQKNLTKYEHHIMPASISRIEEEAKDGKKVCAVEFSKKPVREKFMYYSIPVGLGSPLGLITLRKNIPAFGNSRILSLQHLIKNNRLILGVSRLRSYGADFDTILKTHKNQSNIYVRGGGDAYAGLFKMLLYHRVDYILSYPEEAMFIINTLKIDPHQIIYIPLEEGKVNTDLLSYIACSKTKWGENLIKSINKIIGKERKTDKYRAFFERWMDENNLGVFRKAYKTIFLNSF